MNLGGHSKLFTLGLGVCALGLAACGSSGGSGSETTPAPNTTPWRTLAPVEGTDTETTVALEGGTVTYTIRRGDYANLIAQKAGGECSGPELLDYNPDVRVLIPGKTLQIPAACLSDGVTEESLNAVEEDDTDSDSSDSSDDSDDSDSSDDEEKYNVYEVKTGQSWNGIADRTGCSITQLKAANRGKKLHPGTTLKVPQSCDERDNAEEYTDS